MFELNDITYGYIFQIGKFEGIPYVSSADNKEAIQFNPGQPREKWIRKRTSVKLKNVAANHRANDVIVLEGREQRINARFMYGPLDMITLHGEKVDIHIMKDPPAGEWNFLSTEVTDKTGRISYTVPDQVTLGYGIYPIKMVVRGDHTSVDCYLAVVPPLTECVVFSIDGSFTASMSVTGRDPKVRAGAVDVCRHWQELGYLLIYMTGRPDMQQQRVVSWLSQHNFPHGLISFADGLTTDPLGHKTAYLNNLVQNHGISIIAAYGSSKDISVYSNVGLRMDQIFIVGKVSGSIKLKQSLDPCVSIVHVCLYRLARNYKQMLPFSMMDTLPIWLLYKLSEDPDRQRVMLVWLFLVAALICRDKQQIQDVEGKFDAFITVQKNVVRNPLVQQCYVMVCLNECMYVFCLYLFTIIDHKFIGTSLG